MKLIAVSDIHNEELAFDKLKKILTKEKPDFFLICGDITGSNVSFAQEVTEFYPDTFFIPGNNETKDVLSGIKNNIHGKRTEIPEGLNVVGFGYSNITPFGTPGELTENEIMNGLEKLNIDRNTILMLHVPPKGIMDEAGGHHPGSTSVLEIVNKKKPFLVLFGHIHENKGVISEEETTFVKIPAAKNYLYALIGIKEKKVKVEFKKIE
ncbi:metallophosphoesterase [Candidatus Micrarchaeota archaeon]|nr:metallophosphoesterase [Candidatus Micrarchaeota archaeon]